MDALLSVVHVFREKSMAPHSIFSIARGPSVVRTIAATVFPACDAPIPSDPPQVLTLQKNLRGYFPIRKIDPVFKNTLLRLSDAGIISISITPLIPKAWEGLLKIPAD